MTDSERPKIVLVAGESAAAVPQAWREIAPDLTLAVGVDGLRDVLGQFSSGSQVIVASADTTPGPGLLKALVGCADQGDVIDARTLPIDVGQGAEIDDDAANALADAGMQPAVSGTCVLTTPAHAAALADFWAAPNAGSFADMAAQAGARVVSCRSARVVRHIAVEESGELVAAPVASSALPEPPRVSHPALLEATHVHKVLSAAGVPMPELESEPSRPFLTVLTRTQGTRLECLADVLACLSAQTSRDFEWLVICHRVSPEQRAGVQAVLAQAPAWLSERARIVEVDRQGRAAPLNDGFEAAQGRYIAALDDDDTVFVHWVDTFRRLEDQAAGRVLRAAALKQYVTHDAETDPVAVSVGGWFRPWPSDFDMVDHLDVNHTPLMSVAFPRGAFDAAGQRFDESLAAVEDWEFLIRVAGLVGVVSAGEATSVYRWWLAVHSSRQAHARFEWDRAGQRVRDSFEQTPILAPAKSVYALNERVREAERRVVEVSVSQEGVIKRLEDTSKDLGEALRKLRECQTVRHEMQGLIDEQEEQIFQLRESVASLSRELRGSKNRLRRRIALIERAENRMRAGGVERPHKSIYQMSAIELEDLLDAWA